MNSLVFYNEKNNELVIIHTSGMTSMEIEKLFSLIYVGEL